MPDGMRDDPREYFTPRPIALAALGLCVCLLALIGAGLLTRAFVAGVVLTAFTLSAMRHLFRLRLKRLGSTAAGAALFVLGVAGLIRWGDDIHFRLMEPIYARDAAHLAQTADSHFLRRWDGGLGYDVAITYRNDTTAGDSEQDDGGCDMRWRHMGGHFYLGTMQCNGVPNWKQDKA